MKKKHRWGRAGMAMLLAAALLMSLGLNANRAAAQEFYEEMGMSETPAETPATADELPTEEAETTEELATEEAEPTAELTTGEAEPAAELTTGEAETAAEPATGEAETTAELLAEEAENETEIVAEAAETEVETAGAETEAVEAEPEAVETEAAGAETEAPKEKLGVMLLGAESTGTVCTADDLIAAFENASSGDTITLGADIELSELTDSIPVSTDIRLEFAGYSLTLGADVYAFEIDESGILTLVDAEIEASDDDNNSSVVYNCAGTVNLLSTAGSGITTYLFVYDLVGEGKLNIISGTFDVYMLIDEAEEDTEITVTNAVITAESYVFDDISGKLTIYNADVTTDGTAIYVCSSGEVTIFNGSFTGEDDVINNYGIVTIHAGTFSATDDYGDGPLYVSGDGSFVIPESSYADPEDWEESFPSTVVILLKSITVTFVSENALYDIIDGKPAELTFPEDPISSCGYDFICWEDTDGNVIENLSVLKRDTTLKAVFSDRVYTVTFNDKGVERQVSAVINTPIGELEGLDRREAGDDFIGWKLNGEYVDETSTDPVRSDLTLVACYAGWVYTPEELLEALEAGIEVITLGADIPVTETVRIGYTCTLRSFGGFGLIRPDGFTEALLETTTGVTGGVMPLGIETEESAGHVVVTLDGVLADGRKLEAKASLIIVDENTELILKNTILRDNINAWEYYSEKAHGGAVTNHGTLRMYEGTVISGNSAWYGGGIYNAIPEYEWDPVAMEMVFPYPVTFYMYGGEITGNTATSDSTNCTSSGGGVCVDGRYNSFARFYMYDGKITDNVGMGSGGGVSLGCGDHPVFDTETDEAEIQFYLYGGEISGNKSGGDGGGIYLACSALEMTGGLVKNNTAAETGGGIGACCGCELNINMTGGTISGNKASVKGGGIGTHVGGVLKASAIYGNTAPKCGDDICFYNYSDHLIVTNRMDKLAYGSSPVVLASLIEGEEEPVGVMIPFHAWFSDGLSESANTYGDHYDPDAPRYEDLDSAHFDLDPLTMDLYDDFDDAMPEDHTTEDRGASWKSIWYGLVLLYDANFVADGADAPEKQYDPEGYVTGDTAEALDSMFERTGYVFTGWNSEPDGSGTAYAAGDAVPMNESRKLYARWEKIPVGALAVSVTFASDDAACPFPAAYTVMVTGPEDYKEIIELNAENGWTVTLSELVPGEYTITEDEALAAVEGFTLSVTYEAQVTSVVAEETAGAVVHNVYTKIVTPPETEEPTEETPEESTEKEAEESTEESTENSTEESTEASTEGSAEESTEDSANQPTGDETPAKETEKAESEEASTETREPLPVTGDSNRPILWAVLILASIGSFVAVIVSIFRKKKDE